MADLDERRRLGAVYDGYAEADKWSTSNPGNRAILAEQADVLARMLPVALAEARVLEIGCGAGRTLQLLASIGARPDLLFGVDLLDNGLATAREEGQVAQADGRRLPFHDSSFDVVVFFTVLSSVLDEQVQRQLAVEARRVLTPRGLVVWYDTRWPNPRNPNTTAFSRRRVRRLFPGFSLDAAATTVVPPVARRVCARSDRPYGLLTRVPFLHTHLMGVLTSRR